MTIPVLIFKCGNWALGRADRWKVDTKGMQFLRRVSGRSHFEACTWQRKQHAMNERVQIQNDVWHSYLLQMGPNNVVICDLELRDVKPY